MDEEAVSPVIGVIMMVAITVLLAAVLFVILQDENAGQTDSGTMVGRSEESQDRWVLTIGSGQPQNQYEFSADKDGLRYAWNSTATSASPLMGTDPIPMEGDKPWGAGAFLSLCADGASPLTSVEIQWVNIETNSLVASSKFASIAPCL